MPLIKRGAVALGKGALKTGVRIADDVMSGQSIKRATKRRVTDAGRNLMRGLLAPGVRARKRILFTVPPTQTNIIDSHVVEHQPMSSLESGGPI